MRLLLISIIGALFSTGPLTNHAYGCTTFILDTPDGTFFATNLDLLVPAEGLVFVNRRGIAKQNLRQDRNGNTRKWVSRYGSITFNIAGRGFVWSGMNEAGLVISTMEERSSEYPKPDNRTPFDSGSWIQFLLDNFATVEDVIGVDRSVRLISDGNAPAHFLIADANGQSAVLEYRDGQWVVYTNRHLPIKALTNMPYHRALEAYRRGGPKWWWSNPGRSAERFATAASRAMHYDARAQPNPTEYAATTLMQVADQYTRWNIVYSIAERKVWFRTTRSPATKYLTFEAFDFSCGTPTQMLDIHTPEGGSVNTAFLPYDRKVNLWTFGTMCQRLGVPVSRTDAVHLMDLYDSFGCAR